MSGSEEKLTFLNRAQFRAASRSHITRLMKHVASRDIPFDFRRVVPAPPELEVLRARLMPDIDYDDMDILSAWADHKNSWSESDWSDLRRTVDWCSARWGGAFPPRHVEVHRDRSDATQVTYLFHTAWGPPRGVHAELMQLFPYVHITWDYWDARTRRWRLSIVSDQDHVRPARTAPTGGSRPTLSIVGSETRH